LIWLWLAIGVLILVWIIWPAERRRLPVLLLVRDREEEIEGVLRTIGAPAREVYVLVQESGDETWTIVQRLARQGGVVAIRGDFESGLAATGLAAAVLVRLDDGRPVGTVLRQAGF
jgi:hypothetical protein